MADNLKKQETIRGILERESKGMLAVLQNGAKYEEYLGVVSRFHGYSISNTILIASQKPDATMIRSYNEWIDDFERQVKGGQKSLAIITQQPVNVVETVEVTDDTGKLNVNETGQPVTKRVEYLTMEPKVVRMFDVSQTSGKEVPELVTAPDIKTLLAILEAISPVKVEYSEYKPGSLSHYNSHAWRMGISRVLSDEEKAKQLIHWITKLTLDIDCLSSSMEYDLENPDLVTSSIACIMCKRFGLEADYKFDKVLAEGEWQGFSEIRETFELICSNAHGLITDVEKRIRLQEQEKVVETVENDKDAVDVQIKKPVLSEKEAALLYGHDNYFGIYQLKDTEAAAGYHFMNYEFLQSKGMKVLKENYELVYQEALGKQTLDDIFERFNIHRPDDFTGHSLSVSDIVVVRKDGETKAHFVDSIGYEEIEDFYLQTAIEAAKTEIAYEVNDRYLAVQECGEEGYDYTLFEKDYREIDGGVLANPNITIEQAAKEIVTDLYGDVPMEEVDYIELTERTDIMNAVVPGKENTGEQRDANMSISFYVAECGEFHNMGEYHDNLTLQEAVAIYRSIPSERMNAVKTIGFELQTGLDGILAEASSELFYANMIDMDAVNRIGYIRDNPLVWDAMKELAAEFPDAEISNRETIEYVADELIDFVKDNFPNQFRDDITSVLEEEESRLVMAEEIRKGNAVMDEDFFQELIEEGLEPVEVERIRKIKQRLDDIYLRRELNPLTKVEELEENNYNHLDGTHNNKDAAKTEARGSIREKLEKAKSTIASEQIKPSENKPNVGREEL